jgi:hypothetical protein
MSSKIKSFRTRCTNQRLLSPVSLKRTQPKYLGGGRRVSGRNMCSGDVHGVAPSQFVTPTATVLNHGAAPVRRHTTSAASLKLCVSGVALRLACCSPSGVADV